MCQNVVLHHQKNAEKIGNWAIAVNQFCLWPAVGKQGRHPNGLTKLTHCQVTSSREERPIEIADAIYEIKEIKFDLAPSLI